MTYFDLTSINKSRQALMGISILAVLAFHFGGSFSNPNISRITSLGSLGVEVFLFLSGLGLCYSYEQSESLKIFYLKRVKRILPAWWLILFLMEIRLAVLHNAGPCGFLSHILYYSGLGWWLSPITNNSTTYYEWFIPTLLFFYLIFPLLYQSRKYIIVELLLVIAIVLYLSAQDWASQLSISYQRMPVFMYGVAMYYYFKKGINIKRNIVLIPAMLLTCILFLYVRYLMYPKDNLNICIYRLLFMLMLPAIISLLSKVLILTKYLGPLCTFVGTFSLELYLIHGLDWPFKYMQYFVKNEVCAFIIATLFSIVIAYSIHKLLQFFSKKSLYQIKSSIKYDS